MAIDTSEAPNAEQPPAAVTEVPEGYKICPGSPKHGLPAHQAPLTDFGKNAAYEDGLSRLCRKDASAYTKILRQIKRDQPIAEGGSEAAADEPATAGEAPAAD